MTPEAVFDIRRVGPDDIDLMRRMLDCLGEAFEEPETYSSRQPGSAYLRDLLSGECFVALAAVSGGEVVGGLAAYELRKFEQERSEFYIYDLAVAQAYRRQGIATALISQLTHIASERGGWVVFVQADRGDEPAIELYSKLGVREDVLHFDIPVERTAGRTEAP